MLLDYFHHPDSAFNGGASYTFHHHAVLVNGQQLVCNDSQIGNCVRQCAKQFMPIDQRACVQAVEARFAPYSKCFAATSTVFSRRHTRPIRMIDVEVGDEIMDISMQYVKVVGWLHRDESTVADFLKITHERGTLVVTADHMLFCAEANDFVRAKQVRSLQTIFLDGSLITTKVLSRDQVELKGIYAPLTTSGTLVVDGIHASCYASPVELPFAITQTAGQIALAPYRFIGCNFLPEIENYCSSLYSIFAA